MVTAPYVRTAGLIDAQNRARYGRPDVAAQYRDLRSWVDRGESRVFLDVAGEVRGQPILDVGVGGGRTSWWLRLLSRDYVALDYSPEMVAACRQACPGIDVRLRDARDLSDFDDEHFGLVVFNGLDSVDHDDRRRILEEFHRVLRPEGLLVFSTFNKSGPAWGEAPWQTMRYTASQRPRAERAARLLGRMTLRPRLEIRTYQNWWRLKRCAEDHGGWAIGPGPADNFGVLLHFITPECERQELTGSGFDVSVMFTDNGRPMKPLESAADSFWFYVVARRSMPPTAEW